MKAGFPGLHLQPTLSGDSRARRARGQGHVQGLALGRCVSPAIPRALPEVLFLRWVPGTSRDSWLPSPLSAGDCKISHSSLLIFPDLGVSMKYLTCISSWKSSKGPPSSVSPDCANPYPTLPCSTLPLPRAPPHFVLTPHDSDSPAAVQPHIPATQPGPVVLVLVGGEVSDDGWLPRLQRVGILVRAVPATRHGVGTEVSVGVPNGAPSGL